MAAQFRLENRLHPSGNQVIERVYTDCAVIECLIIRMGDFEYD